MLGAASAVAKSADDITLLLNVSDLDNSALADATGDYFEDCSLHGTEEVGSISEDCPETGSNKLSVITSMLITLIAANNKETKKQVKKK